MLIRCPTCHGKGRVPDMSHTGSMCYCDPYTGESWPHEWCQSCAGSGWVEDGTPAHRAPVAPREETDFEMRIVIE
jgi:hypothetical protein